MKKHSISFKETGLFNTLLIDYIEEKESMRHLYSYVPSRENFPSIFENRKSVKTDRALLHKTIASQYDGIELSDSARENLAHLKEENTFSVCTAHQLNIFTGPLYIIYKALSAIKLADQLNEQFQEYSVVPIFWLGSEDHDLEEIDHFNLFGQTYKWETDQSGAVGRMNAKELQDAYSAFSEKLRNEELKTLIEKHYLNTVSLSAATRSLLNALFGERGLLVLDADDKNLKASFTDTMRKELLESVSAESIAESLQFLEENYKVQAQPRAINLFYLKDNLRQRIVKEGEEWKVLNSDIHFSKEELLTELNNHPERFSPNVILRPVYQEHVLPNLAYLGGAGELAYWFQLKESFEKLDVHFPMLLPRDMNLIVEQKRMAKWEGLGFSKEDLFSSDIDLSKRYVKDNSEKALDLEEEKETLKKLFEELARKVSQIDGSLSKTTEAEGVKMMKALDGLEKRVHKAEKKKHEVQLNQIGGLLARLFPGGGPQERSENILAYLDKYGLEFLDKLYEAADPMDLTYSVLVLSSK